MKNQMSKKVVSGGMALILSSTMFAGVLTIPSVSNQESSSIVQSLEASAASVKTYSKSKNGNTYLSANFQVKEFACKDGSDTILIDPDLVTYLQKIRDHFGKSVTINSGYRTVTYNAKIGGATNSYHTKGQAADIAISGVSPKEIAQYAESIGIKGIGLYSTFVHIDTRTSKYYWNQTSGTAVSTNSFGGTTTSSTSSSSSSSGVMIVNTSSSSLNMRNSASTSSSVVTSVPKGSYVSVLGISGNWIKVSYKGQTGYCSNSYLKSLPTATKTVATSSSSLNMRSNASTSSSILTSIPKGATVYVIKTSGSWSYVVYNGYCGWCSNSYLK